MKKSDYRIQLTLDYSPVLKNYPPEITSKQKALQFDLKSLFEGTAELEDLLSSVDDVLYEVVAVPILDISRGELGCPEQK